MIDVTNKLWDFCNYLRHDGITYGNYIEQLTFLLFLKMSKEKEVKLPPNCSWDDLIQYAGSELLQKYTEILEKLGQEKGILGDIFVKSRSEFTNPVNLKKLLNLINEIEWTSLDIDIKGRAYEGLLEKFAAEEKGAGQYFTPRVVIRSIVRCIKPDFRKSSDFKIHDPACGTGGFLIGAFEWIMEQTERGSKLTIRDRERLMKNTFSGMDIVLLTKRLALMNCYLHNIEPAIYFGDALGEGPHVGQRYNVVLTNPPFGSKGAGGASDRNDFIISTSNKQLNFIQHVMTILKPGGEAAMVVPDNVLFERTGKKLREFLVQNFNLHTILRLPEGIFSPYSTGVKANVIFFTKGKETNEVWIYDLRTNIDTINKGNPLNDELFLDFEKCYAQNPRKTAERFKKFKKTDIEKKEYNLDIFWLKNKSIEDPNDLPDPLILANEASHDLKLAIDSLNELTNRLKTSR